MRSPGQTEGHSRRGKVQSAEVGLLVLGALADLDGIASLSALAAATGIAAPKVHRYIASLISAGFVRQDSEGGSYRLGLRSLTVGLAALRANDAVRLAGDRLPGLRDATGATCFVAVPANGGPTVLLVAEARGAVIVNVRLGSTLPEEGSATGLVLRAFTEPPPTDEPAAAIRAIGSASIVDTVLAGVSAVSAAVRDHLGNPVAAITSLAATGTIDVGERGSVAREVRAAAEAVSASVGFKPRP